MTDKEAIEYLKKIKDKDLWKLGYVYGGEAIETVLHLLETKNAENIKLSEICLKKDKEIAILKGLLNEFRNEVEVQKALRKQEQN